VSEETELGNNLFEEAAPAPAKAKRTPKAKDDWYEERQWIVVEESPEIPLTGLSLSHNGNVVMLMPGEPVHLQNKYIEILDHAIISVPQLDGAQRVVGSRQRHRFPYRKVDAPANPA
jgi:hypothetical protein